MAFFSSLFSSKPVAPKRVLTDTVIPLFDRDDTRTNRSISLEFTMAFDEVLDANKLSSALWKLIERPGWRKLGARLRLNDAGKLEYHIPAQYTQDRPPINYTHTTESMPFSQHRLGQLLPRPNGKLQVFGDSAEFRVFSESDHNTRLLEDWIYSDKAQLGLHIVSFEDATLVTITWLHTLLDAMGRHALLSAWQAVLEGRDNEVPEFIGYDVNPLEELGKDKTAGEEYVLKDRMLGWLALARFVFNFVWEGYWYPKEKGQTICIPASYFAKIKAAAFADLKSLDASKLTLNAADSKPFISDGDILTAWFLRLLARTNPGICNASPARIVAIMNVFGMRDLLRSTEPQLLPKDGAYIHNCASPIMSFFSTQDFLALPLGHVAAQIRKDLVAQSTRAQVEASQALSRAHNDLALYGSSNMALCTMTNWAKAKLFETDFSAAIVGEGSGKARGKPVYIHPFTKTSKDISVRGAANVTGKDAEGNFWLSTTVRAEFKDAFVKAVEEMS